MRRHHRVTAPEAPVNERALLFMRAIREVATRGSDLERDAVADPALEELLLHAGSALAESLTSAADPKTLAERVPDAGLLMVGGQPLRFTNVLYTWEGHGGFAWTLTLGDGVLDWADGRYHSSSFRPWNILGCRGHNAGIGEVCAVLAGADRVLAWATPFVADEARRERFRNLTSEVAAILEPARGARAPQGTAGRSAETLGGR